MPTDDLSGRIAIVTGATAGIGRAVAEDLAARGARLILNARRAEKLTQLTRTLNAARPEPLAAAAPGDAADQAVIDSMLTAAVTHFGAEADIIVVNAGRGLSGSVISSDPAQWEDMLRTNVLGAARLLRAAALRMAADIVRRDAGNWQARPRDLIAIGSVVGRHVSPFSSMYGSTKFAVHGMVEGVRRELASKGIRVSLIEPGFVVSEFQGVAGYQDDWFKGVVERIGPVLQPADVAAAVSFICRQPPHVHVGDILIRPTRQDYP